MFKSKTPAPAAQKNPNDVQHIADVLDFTDWGKAFEWDEIKTIARYMNFMEYPAGHVIFNEGDKENYMAILASGSVNIMKQSADETEKIVVTISKGGIIGEMALIDSEPRSATAVTVTPVTLLTLSQPNFDKMANDFPVIGVKALRRIALALSRRLRQTTGRFMYLK